MKALGDQELPLIVLGGLVPEVLTSGQEPPAPEHLGTTDVDIHLGLRVDPEVDMGALERALETIDFSPDPKVDGWRWRGPIEGVVIKVEFLCDLDDRPGGQIVNLRGCKRLTAANLRGTGFVTEDYEWEEITAELDAKIHSVRVRFAGLGGYLMSKAFAARTRGLEKDYYDFAYTLLYNRLGGPIQAAESLVRSGKFIGHLRVSSDPWPELGARFSTSADVGPRGYANSALLADPGGDRAVLQQDAVGAVAEFLETLKSEGPAILDR